MSFECDLAEKIVEARRKQAEVNALREVIKDAWYNNPDAKPFAVELDGCAVTVKHPSVPSYYSRWGKQKRPMPVTTVIPLVERCNT